MSYLVLFIEAKLFVAFLARCSQPGMTILLDLPLTDKIGCNAWLLNVPVSVSGFFLVLLGAL